MTAEMTAAASHPVRAALKGIVGDAHVLTEGDLSAFELDWRRRVRGKALAVVRPAATREVAAAMRAIKNAFDPLNLLNPGRVLAPHDTLEKQ